MAGWTVDVHPRVPKELSAIERGGRRNVVRRIQRALRRLGEDPLTPRPGMDIRPVKGAREPSHRLRVGEYRILIDVDLERRRVFVLRVSRKG